MPSYAFPQDLLDAQAALDEVQAEHDLFAQVLPWSADAMPGHRPEQDARPGYTPEQAERLAAYRARILDLTTQVITHPYWESLPGPDRVEARTVLRHVNDPDDPGA
ncbi:hypothetical protein OHT61_26005 [Streptomyces sp. NBC_00178]|uniref:hypothetical protein n=1 Tax=Streptomyces sp. NBC_00178 TaxID=2975672 RepID=UPI002E2B0477|nr:hypothetical protein [Streptomyces sp. NBC_00178]